MADGKELILFQLGPVQDFIAQAETVGDLRAGSEMLSELTAAAFRVIPDYSTEAVFPAVKADGDLKGIPNRFLAFVPQGRGEEIGRAAANAAQGALQQMAAEAFAKTGLPEASRTAFNRQVAAFLQTNWAVLKRPTGRMGADYKTLGKLMALRRNVRTFDAWHEEGSGVVKDFLSGKETALDVAYGVCGASRCGGRGAMNLIKKVRETANGRLGVEELGPYVAVIALDGDHMGAALSGFATQEEHRAFSEKLAAFAHSVKIAPEDGVLVYAGGDDVLAVVKATRAIPLARELAAAFGAKMGAAGITASAGVAIGSAKAPLQDVIREARAAEGRAKRVYGRDALAMSVLKRSGETLHWGCKWVSKALDIYAELSKAREAEVDLSRFAYKFAGFLKPYDLSSVKTLDGAMREILCAETLHVLEQTEGATAVLSQKLLSAYLAEAGVTARPADYLGLFLCEAFINRPRGE